MVSDPILERELLRDLLARFLAESEFPEFAAFRYVHKQHRELLDALEQRGLIRREGNLYVLSRVGLLACDNAPAFRLIETCNDLIPVLQDIFRQSEIEVSSAAPHSVAALMGLKLEEATRALRFLSYDSPFALKRALDHAGDDYVEIGPTVVDLALLPTSPEVPPTDEPPAVSDALRLTEIAVSGYRPFASLSAAFGDLTVIIGANASGKSSLFDFLHLVSFAVQAPLPPEIDPRSLGRTLFHAGMPQRLSFMLDAAGGNGSNLRYQVEIQGPVGSVKVASEVLSSIASPEAEPEVLLDLRFGKGSVREASSPESSRIPWTAPPNELALRRVLDPRLSMISSFQGFLASFRFYPGFDISPDAALRRPTHTDEAPILAENGANLSAVLHAMLLEHREAWQELELYLQAAIPGFESIGVKTRGGKGMVVTTWRERGVPEELTLADLSDGTVRLLCWLTLALSPNLPPVICIDEPEIGLHPRVLPILAGAFKQAAARSQLIVATHSPQLLAEFRFEDIAVMHKEEGRAVFVRPSSSAALRREVEEIGGEAITRLFLSDELEARS